VLAPTTGTPAPLSAESALSSVEAAEAYLARHPDQDFVRELRAVWRLDGKGWKPQYPSPIRQVRAAERHARALLKMVGARSSTGRALQVYLRQVESRDPGHVEYRRRLATDPEDGRFALLLANHAWTLSCRNPTDLRVSGRLAAVMARAEGVKKPKARRKVRPEDDVVGAELRAWEAAMARAYQFVARWRASEEAE